LLHQYQANPRGEKIGPEAFNSATCLRGTLHLGLAGLTPRLEDMARKLSDIAEKIESAPQQPPALPLAPEQLLD
jgi:hypothetical protein